VSSVFDPTLFGAVFVTLFVIMNPLGRSGTSTCSVRAPVSHVARSEGNR
jgi:hypothetical protein